MLNSSMDEANQLATECQWSGTEAQHSPLYRLRAVPPISCIMIVNERVASSVQTRVEKGGMVRREIGAEGMQIRELEGRGRGRCIPDREGSTWQAPTLIASSTFHWTGRWLLHTPVQLPNIRPSMR